MKFDHMEYAVIKDIISRLATIITWQKETIVRRDVSTLRIGSVAWPYERDGIRDYGAIAIGNEMATFWSSKKTTNKLLSAIGFKNACLLLNHVVNWAREERKCRAKPWLDCVAMVLETCAKLDELIHGVATKQEELS